LVIGTTIATMVPAEVIPFQNMKTKFYSAYGALGDWRRQCRNGRART